MNPKYQAEINEFKENFKEYRDSRLLQDYWLSNSDWYDKTLKAGSLYEGKTLRTGSPRCDILVKASNDKEFKDKIKLRLCENYEIKVENPDEILSGCDAFMTDYSSVAFDAAVIKIPIFLYCDDYAECEGENSKESIL